MRRGPGLTPEGHKHLQPGTGRKASRFESQEGREASRAVSTILWLPGSTFKSSQSKTEPSFSDESPVSRLGALTVGNFSGLTLAVVFPLCLKVSPCLSEPCCSGLF